MATMYPVIPDIPPGGWGSNYKSEPDMYTVGVAELNGKIRVYAGRPWLGCERAIDIKPKDRWFDVFTGTTYEGRIRNAIDKLQRWADVMNEKRFKVDFIVDKSRAALND